MRKVTPREKERVHLIRFLWFLSRRRDAAEDTFHLSRSDPSLESNEGIAGGKDRKRGGDLSENQDDTARDLHRYIPLEGKKINLARHIKKVRIVRQFQ